MLDSITSVIDFFFPILSLLPWRVPIRDLLIQTHPVPFAGKFWSRVKMIQILTFYRFRKTLLLLDASLELVDVSTISTKLNTNK